MFAVKLGESFRFTGQKHVSQKERQTFKITKFRLVVGNQILKLLRWARSENAFNRNRRSFAPIGDIIILIKLLHKKSTHLVHLLF